MNISLNYGFCIGFESSINTSIDSLCLTRILLIFYRAPEISSLLEERNLQKFDDSENMHLNTIGRPVYLRHGD